MRTRHPVKAFALILAPTSLALAASCAAPPPSGYHYVKTQEIANAAYTSPIGEAMRGGQETAGGYLGPYWSPDRFASQGKWPALYTYGQKTGPGACLQTGSIYACDTNGDGLADVHGDQATGAYAAASEYVNTQGQAFEWDLWCKCWQRRPAKDGPRQPANLGAPTAQEKIVQQR